MLKLRDNCRYALVVPTSMGIGKNENYINQLESSSFIVPSDVLFQIIDALEIKPEEFFAEDYKNYQTKKELLNLLDEVINAVPMEKITKLLNSLKR